MVEIIYGRASGMSEKVLFNSSVGSTVGFYSVRDWIILGEIVKCGCWLLIQRFLYGVPDIQARIAFIWSCLTRDRRRDKGSFQSICGILLGCHGGLREIKRGRWGNNQ